MGTASLDDIPAQAGTVVIAVIEGITVGSAEVDRGRYALKIRKERFQSFDGKEVSFKIGSFAAQETVIWAADGGGELNLTGTKYFAF